MSGNSNQFRKKFVNWSTTAGVMEPNVSKVTCGTLCDDFLFLLFMFGYHYFHSFSLILRTNYLLSDIMFPRKTGQ